MNSIDKPSFEYEHSSVVPPPSLSFLGTAQNEEFWKKLRLTFFFLLLLSSRCLGYCTSVSRLDHITAAAKDDIVDTGSGFASWMFGPRRVLCIVSLAVTFALLPYTEREESEARLFRLNLEDLRTKQAY